MNHFVHLKRGTRYALVGRGTVQNSSGEPIGEGDRLVAYRCDTGALYFRPEQEFDDGRFIAGGSTAPPAAEAGWDYDMRAAPKHRPIWALCDHDAGPFYEPDRPYKLTLYAAHAEGLGARPGRTQCVAVWGGSYGDDDTWLPDWWFDAYSEFELPVNPIAWRELPPSD